MVVAELPNEPNGLPTEDWPGDVEGDGAPCLVEESAVDESISFAGRVAVVDPETVTEETT